MPLSIDTKFLGELEGFTTEGIVPLDDKGVPLGTSGVTVGTGIDLGHQDEKGLRDAGVRPDIIRKVKLYLGKKKEEAQSLLEKMPLQLTPEEAQEISSAVVIDSVDKLASRYNKDSTQKFEELPPKMQTVLVSLHHQFGNKVYGYNAWDQATSGDWPALVDNLRDFGDDYPTRRNREADYLEGQ